MSTEPTWFVLRSNGGGVAVAKFSTEWCGNSEEEARQKARELSRKEQGVCFYVMEASAKYCSKVQVVVEQIEL